MAYGRLLADHVVMLTDKEHGGKPIVETAEPESIPIGYKSKSVWVDTGTQIMLVYDIVPEEGTAEESVLKLAQMQALSLSDDEALEVPALYPEWFNGETYTTGQRIRYRGILYKVLQGHVSQADWTPDVASSLYTKVLPGQSGEIGEWVQPDSTNGYATGDKVIYNGHLWQSTADDNVWKPGDVGAPWTDLGEYSPEA